jgi:dihydrodipicolinate synthase/N-acetylneuraminate lyase
VKKDIFAIHLFLEDSMPEKGSLLLYPGIRIRPKRKITGYSAILLPFRSNGKTDWDGFENHIRRTVKAGLVPVVNMDTGYVNLISEQLETEVLDHTSKIMAGSRFAAGVFIRDTPGNRWNPEAYRRSIRKVLDHGGIPVIMQCYGLKNVPEKMIPKAYQEITADCDEFIAFELGTAFADFGRIYDLKTYAEIMEMENCIGAKHSSLSRELEWQRLILRDKCRPDFKVFTGNDLAIDMVMYGSDYLLGLSSFAPDCFALRDRFWEKGDIRFHELNDCLQFLGEFAFRFPVPAYKHNAAQFLKLQGWIDSDRPAQGSPRRPASDIEILKLIKSRLDAWRKSK